MTIQELIAKAEKLQRKNTRQPPRDEEHRIQCECVAIFRAKYPHLAPLLFAVPNGGKRDAKTGSKLKAEGVVAGVADLLLLVPNHQYHALCIEMKTANGAQSRSQKLWEEHVKAQGFNYVVCRSTAQFLEAVDNHLSPSNTHIQCANCTHAKRLSGTTYMCSLNNTLRSSSVCFTCSQHTP